jgi:prophage regulatory protein
MNKHGTAGKSDRVLRRPEVCKTVGLSATTVWRRERAGEFPRRIRLGGNSVGWLSSEIDCWLVHRAEQRSE